MPSREQMHKEDQEKLLQMGISEISNEDQAGDSGPSPMQKKFMETLKFRMDARIVKILKHKKKMKMQELTDQVVHDL